MKKDDNDKGKTGVLKRGKSQKRIEFGIEKKNRESVPLVRSRF
ncbi:hypothetical protein [Niallia sp. FSL W8-0954]